MRHANIINPSETMLLKEITRLEKENKQLFADLAHRDGLYRNWKAWAESLERKDAECPAE